MISGELLLGPIVATILVRRISAYKTATTRKTPVSNPLVLFMPPNSTSFCCYHLLGLIEALFKAEEEHELCAF